ncbi:hypothetical protein VNO77_04756 [Canavalia gladiata]|uniref:Uncharacterized protein n=1 Tax=Canavalia gladiata TaxID=3824 RepID=A0AAN9N264_CANGL
MISLLKLMIQWLKIQHQQRSRGEVEDALLFRMDMYGPGKEKVKISGKWNTFTIKGEYAKESDKKEGMCHCSSRIDLLDKFHKTD